MTQAVGPCRARRRHGAPAGGRGERNPYGDPVAIMLARRHSRAAPSRCRAMRGRASSSPPAATSSWRRSARSPRTRSGGSWTPSSPCCAPAGRRSGAGTGATGATGPEGSDKPDWRHRPARQDRPEPPDLPGRRAARVRRAPPGRRGGTANEAAYSPSPHSSPPAPPAPPPRGRAGRNRCAYTSSVIAGLAPESSHPLDSRRALLVASAATMGEQGDRSHESSS